MDKKNIRLSLGEMELMRMLWEKGPLTLAEAHREFCNYGGSIAYPTMQTRLNRLVDKEFAGKSDQRPAQYRALVTLNEATKGSLGQVLEKLKFGSVIPLMQHLISEKPLTTEEIQELKKILQKAEQKAKKKRVTQD